MEFCSISMRGIEVSCSKCANFMWGLPRPSSLGNRRRVPGLKWPEHNADHSSAAVMKDWSCTSVCLNGMHRGNFTSAFGRFYKSKANSVLRLMLVNFP